MSAHIVMKDLFNFIIFLYGASCIHAGFALESCTKTFTCAWLRGSWFSSSVAKCGRYISAATRATAAKPRLFTAFSKAFERFGRGFSRRRCQDIAGTSRGSCGTAVRPSVASLARGGSARRPSGTARPPETATIFRYFERCRWKNGVKMDEIQLEIQVQVPDFDTWPVTRPPTRRS